MSSNSGGQSAKVNVVAPYSWLGGNAVFAGQPIQRSVNGLTDTSARLSVNFFGAPAMDLEEFQNYQQDLILGASLTVTAPTGQYDPSRLVNLGTNRWFVRPELGASKAFGHLTIELSAGPAFFTDNTNFLNGHTTSEPRAGGAAGFNGPSCASASGRRKASIIIPNIRTSARNCP
jgi:hypothetical protein